MVCSRTKMCFSFVSVVFLCLSCAATEDDNIPKTVVKKNEGLLGGHPLKCIKRMETHVDLFEVLPGIGWDNIQNTELSQVLDRKYDQCKLTEDGKYLVPDNVLLIPVKQSNVDVFAEWFENMQEYKSVDSFSVNGGGSFSLGLEGLFGVSSSFSAGYQSAKMHMSKSTTSTFVSRVQARYNRYRVVADTQIDLHPSFRARLLEIASNFYNHHNHIANYQCQLLIRDFGTHVLTRMDAGAVLYKEDHIEAQTNTVDDVKKKQWKLGAGASFSAIFDGVSIGGGFNFGMGQSKTDEAITEYYNKTTFSVIKAQGGIYFDGNTTSREWTTSLDNELVAIDRDGIPLYELVSSSALPELPLDTLLKLTHGVKNAYISYYKHNTYRGCMNPNNKNFDIRANVANDAVCGDDIFEDQYFGGVYQNCSMSKTDAGDTCVDKGYIQKNPLTGDFSCPEGYKEIELLSESITDSQYHEEHPSFWHRRRHSYTSYSYGRYNAFWCARDPSFNPDQKLLFGGVFSTNFKPNIVTGGFSCPVSFNQLRLADDVYICVGDENDIGIKFGGFFSCQNGNPIALIMNMTEEGAVRILNGDKNSWPKRCPHGMVQHTFSITSDCELEFCSDVIDQGRIQQLPALRRPPFIKRPSVPPANFTEMVMVVDGKWFKGEAAFKKIVEMDTLDAEIKKYKKAQDALDRASLAVADLYNNTGTNHMKSSDGNLGDTLPSYAIAVISSVATLICVLAATMMYRRVRQKRNLRSRIRDQDEIERASVNQGSSYGTLH